MDTLEGQRICLRPLQLSDADALVNAAMPLIPQHFILHETEHWIVNHRLNSALPGYVMLGARANVSALHELPESALAELGPLLAKTQRIVETLFKPKRLYIGRYGHEPDHPIHFHVIPIYDWVEDLFWQDERYRVLETFSSPNPDSICLLYTSPSPRD